jgi:hypothetical protein
MEPHYNLPRAGGPVLFDRFRRTAAPSETCICMGLIHLAWGQSLHCKPQAKPSCARSYPSPGLLPLRDYLIRGLPRWLGER